METSGRPSAGSTLSGCYAKTLAERGHAFNDMAGGAPEAYVSGYNDGELLVRPGGFVEGYHFGQDNSASEIFADMYVGWVYGKWKNDALGPFRNTVMTTNMTDWITRTQQR